MHIFFFLSHFFGVCVKFSSMLSWKDEKSWRLIDPRLDSLPSYSSSLFSPVGLSGASSDPRTPTHIVFLSSKIYCSSELLPAYAVLANSACRRRINPSPGFTDFCFSTVFSFAPLERPSSNKLFLYSHVIPELLVLHSSSFGTRDSLMALCIFNYIFHSSILSKLLPLNLLRGNLLFHWIPHFSKAPILL